VLSGCLGLPSTAPGSRHMLTACRALAPPEAVGITMADPARLHGLVAGMRVAVGGVGDHPAEYPEVLRRRHIEGGPYVPGTRSGPQLTPDGTYHPAGRLTLCPDGSLPRAERPLCRGSLIAAHQVAQVPATKTIIVDLKRFAATGSDGVLVPRLMRAANDLTLLHVAAYPAPGSPLTASSASPPTSASRSGTVVTVRPAPAGQATAAVAGRR